MEQSFAVTISPTKDFPKAPPYWEFKTLLTMDLQTKTTVARLPERHKSRLTNRLRAEPHISSVRIVKQSLTIHPIRPLPKRARIPTVSRFEFHPRRFIRMSLRSPHRGDAWRCDCCDTSPGRRRPERERSAAIKSVKKEGQGNDDAGPAWKTVVGKGAPALMPALESFDETNRIAANWLRTAVDAIAETETNAGRKLPADKLEAFALNAKFAPSARRKAYELLIAQDAGAKTRLLPRFLDDKSSDLRRDAIAHQLESLEADGRKPSKADLEKLFALARDQDQIESLAKKLAANGGKPSVTEHFGFVNHAVPDRPIRRTGKQGIRTRPSARKGAGTDRLVQGQGRRERDVEAGGDHRQVRRAST